MDRNVSHANPLAQKAVWVDSVHRYCTLVAQYFEGICSCKICPGLLIKHETNFYFKGNLSSKPLQGKLFLQLLVLEAPGSNDERSGSVMPKKKEYHPSGCLPV